VCYTAAMSPTRPRRPLLKRACLWTVAVVPVLGWYVSSYAVVQWLFGRQKISVPTATGLDATVFAPLIVYDGPGSESLQNLRVWCYFRGAGFPVKWG
jgi:hypothetical protein